MIAFIQQLLDTGMLNGQYMYKDHHISIMLKIDDENNKLIHFSAYHDPSDGLERKSDGNYSNDINLFGDNISYIIKMIDINYH